MRKTVSPLRGFDLGGAFHPRLRFAPPGVTHGVTPPALDAKNQKWVLGKSGLPKEKIKLNMPLFETYGMVVLKIYKTSDIRNDDIAREKMLVEVLMQMRNDATGCSWMNWLGRAGKQKD